MKIVNQYRNSKIEKNVDSLPNLILGNNMGDYLYLCGEESRYQGFYFADQNSYDRKPVLYKVIDEIRFSQKSETIELKNSFFKVEKKDKSGLVESYFIPGGYNSLCVKTNRLAEADIILDVRRPYDSRQMGRFYKMEVHNDCLVIEFIKRRDWSEDNLGGKKEFSLYLAIKTDKDSFEEIGKFFSKYYPKDHKRNSYPWDRYVFFASRITFRQAVFSVSKTRKQAVAEVKEVFKNFDKLYKKNRDDLSNLEAQKISDPEIKMACLCSQNSIRTLLSKNKFVGAYAGIPWFFQFWHRDEALSLSQIHKLDRKAAEEIINLQLDSILKSGCFQKQRFPESIDELQSADAIGLLAKACGDIFKRNGISKLNKKEIINKFEKVLTKLLKDRTREGLAFNSTKETWMDSLDRSGQRIEIQAGRLALLSLLFEETKNDQYKILLSDMQKIVREKFYHDDVLRDAPESETVRPNIFLAYYLYPELLKSDEWEKCFNKILPQLYLNWGGVASVSLLDKRFIPKDCGENSPSYHNGDSWYFLNNIVAISLFKTNAAKYSEYINEIMEASTNELLYMGAIGHHSEISSAYAQESGGCQAQLWSSAMFLEFFDVVTGE